MRRVLWIAAVVVWPCVAWSQANNLDAKALPSAPDIQPPTASPLADPPSRPPFATDEVRRPLPRRPPLPNPDRPPLAFPR